LGRLPLALALPLANFFDPSVKLPLALSKGLCHKQPIETKQTKEIIIMEYTVALSVAAKATAYLQDNEGNMSETDVAVHVSALHLALKAIADHNAVELPPLP
jgi:hypothetical protein